MDIQRAEGKTVTYGTWLRLWLRELRISVTEQPMLLVPHPHQPARSGPADGYRCTWCGSRSAQVQDKGARNAQELRARLS